MTDVATENKVSNAPPKDRAITTTLSEAAEAEEQVKPEPKQEAKPEAEELPSEVQEKINKRIGKEVARRAQAEQERDFWRSQAMRGGVTKPETNGVPAPSQKAPEGKPDPTKFSNPADYIEAIAEWKADEKLRQRDEQQAKERQEAEQKKLQERWNEQVQTGRTKYDDFDDAMGANIPLRPAMSRAIIESDVGAEIAYHLAKHPQEAARISEMSEVAQAREIGRIEAMLSVQASQKTRVSTAKEPIKPIGDRGAATAATDPETMSYREWRRMRDEESRSRRRR